MALISRGGQLVLVDSGLPHLSSCATPVVPEMGGRKGGEAHIA
jgi:hypothetical protein